jgi:serine/threonine protein kinase
MVSGGPGRLVAGRYRLAALAGRGSMGVVWQARDELLGRDVAVKELLWPEHFSAPEWQAACQRAVGEARLAARISHRNVIRVFDVVTEDGCPWIVTELVRGRALDQVIRAAGPIHPDEAARIGLGLLAALRAAHAAGIVHRDVKPANVLVQPDRVVLTDFGIARASGTPASAGPGLLIGSPSYLAPERACGRESGPPDDLWGLGATLYAAVEGHGPFEREEGAQASLTAVVTDELPPAARAGALWPAISGLLRKDPRQRLGAAAAERMLRDVSASPAVPAQAVPPRTVPAQAVPPRTVPAQAVPPRTVPAQAVRDRRPAFALARTGLTWLRPG